MRFILNRTTGCYAPDSTVRMLTPDMVRKVGVNIQGLSMYGEMILCPVPATKRGQAPSRQHRATPSI